MTKNTLINIILAVFVLISTPAILRADGTEEKALTLFEKSEYNEAIPLYEELLRYYPNDPMFNYYWGVCQTETNVFSQKAKRSLLFASTNDVPSNVYFFIAKQYHATNDFETALSYYERFERGASRKERKKLELDALIKQCRNAVNPFTSKISEEMETKKVEEIEGVINEEQITPIQEKTKSEQKEEKIEVVEETPESIEIPIPPVQIASETTVTEIDTTELDLDDDRIEVPVVKETTPDESFKNDDVLEELTKEKLELAVNARIYYHKYQDFKTEGGRNMFAEAWKKEKVLKNMLVEMDSLRQAYTVVDDVAKGEIASRVLELEQKSINLKAEKVQVLLNVVDVENAFWQEVPESLWEKFIVEQQKELSQKKELKQEESEVETITEEVIEVVPEVVEQNAVPVVNIEYRIQIGAYSKGLPGYVEKLYSRLSTLRKIENYTDDRGVVVYTVGRLDNYLDAVRMQKQIRTEGVQDAFVVAYKNGVRIRVSEAINLENNE